MEGETDLQLFFTKVDGSFPGRHKDLQPIIAWKSSTTPVATEFRLPIPVEHSGSVVDYSFETLHNDIQFEVRFQPADDAKDGVGEEGEEIIVERQRCDSHLGPVTGTIPLTRPGRLTIVWDNGHSWFKHKILSYSVTLHVPSLLATERAKCSRAANALRVCARERDSCHARGQEAAAQGRETRATVQSLQEELLEVQRKLDEASLKANELEREVEDCQQRERLEEHKIRGLTFRLMPQDVLAHTLSYGSEDEQWLVVCNDWEEVLSPPVRAVDEPDTQA